MTLAPVDHAAAAPPLNRVAAERRLDKIKRAVASAADLLTTVGELIAEAEAAGDHQTLGYPSLEAYYDDALGGLSTIRLDRQTREVIICKLFAAGLSRGLIESVTGIPKSTVHRDIAASGVPDGTPERVTGPDGKSYPAARPPKPDQADYDEPDEGELLNAMFAARAKAEAVLAELGAAIHDVETRTNFLVVAPSEWRVLTEILAPMRLLPTPLASDGSRSGEHPDVRRGYGANGCQVDLIDVATTFVETPEVTKMLATAGGAIQRPTRE